MSDKELKKMKRGDLVDIIHKYKSREKKLIKENTALKEKLASCGIEFQDEAAVSELYEESLASVFYIEKEKKKKEKKNKEDKAKKGDNKDNKDKKKNCPYCGGGKCIGECKRHKKQ